MSVDHFTSSNHIIILKCKSLMKNESKLNDFKIWGSISWLSRIEAHKV